MSSPSWAAWTSSSGTWTADGAGQADRRRDHRAGRALPIEAVGHHPGALGGSARAGLRDQGSHGRDRADPWLAALADRGHRLLLLDVPHPAGGPPRRGHLCQRALHAARRRRDDRLPRSTAGRPRWPDHHGRCDHLALDDRVPGCLRRCAHDAGRPPFRGEPYARADRRHHPAAEDRPGAASREAGEGCSGRRRPGGEGRAAETEEDPELMGLKPVLTKDFHTENLEQLAVYERTGGYTGFKKALGMQPDELNGLGKTSGLRGRGGAGFPTGNKWSFLPKGVYPRYFICNADESEPGSFKDRYLMEKSPHQVLEGILIASYAIGCNLAFIYIRGEYLPQHEALEAAIDEARQAGYLGKNVLGKGSDVDIILHRGAGAYICGEETALLTSLEGYRGEPRLKPPFPAGYGLYGKPTVVNNVEPVCNLPPILLNGADC